MKEKRWLVGWRGRIGNHEVRGVKAVDPWEAVRVVRAHVGYHERQESTEWLRVCEWTAGCQKEFERMGLKGGLEWQQASSR